MGLSGVGTSTSSRGYENLEILYSQSGRYQVNDKPASEEEVNNRLSASGIRATDGQFRTADGFEITASHNGAATDFGGATPLPDVVGPATSRVNLSEKAGWMNEISDGALMWQAISEMARVSQREMKDAKEIKQAMNKMKIEAKQEQINATEQQIAAEREAAAEALTTAICVAVITCVIACVGAYMSAATSASNAAGSADAASKGQTFTAATDYGAVVSAMGSSVGGVVQAYGTYASKTSGAQRDADEAKLKAKRWEREEAIMDDSIDEAKGNYEEAKEQFKLSLRILTEHMERQTQVIQKITS